MSGFIKRFLLSLVASKLERRAYRRGPNPAVDGLLREVNHRLSRRRPHGHHGSYGYHGHYRNHGYHGHYKRKRW